MDGYIYIYIYIYNTDPKLLNSKVAVFFKSSPAGLSFAPLMSKSTALLTRIPDSYPDSLLSVSREKTAQMQNNKMHLRSGWPFLLYFI